MADKLDYYKILGITDDEKKLSGDQFNDIVKKRYKKLAIKYHPDKWSNGTDAEKKEAEEKFKEINEANSVLSDQKKRQQYDLGGSDGFSGFGDFDGFDPFGAMDDFFGRSQPRVEKGQDVRVDIYLTLNEIHNGVKNKSITYNKPCPCSKCNGTGSNDGSDTTCSKCHGTGYFTIRNLRGNTMFAQQTVCPDCNGSGKIIKNKCKQCNGSGFEQVSVSINVDVPKGVFEGAAIEMQGLGGVPKSKNGIPGNLVVVFHEKQDNILKRDGNNLHVILELDIDEALCGCEKEIKTIDNKIIKIKIPELTECGKILRLVGKGTYNLQFGDRIGDMYVEIKYRKLDKISDKQKQLIKEFYGRK